jgi:hypothetical protein
MIQSLGAAYWSTMKWWFNYHVYCYYYMMLLLKYYCYWFKKMIHTILLLLDVGVIIATIVVNILNKLYIIVYIYKTHMYWRRSLKNSSKWMRNMSTAARNSVLQTRNLLLETGSRETLRLHRLPVCEKNATSVSPFAVLKMKFHFFVEFYGPWKMAHL